MVSADRSTLINIEHVVKEFFSSYENQKFCVGVSGGIDSMVLLTLMAKCSIDVCAFTFDHGLRPTSADDVMAVKNYCKQLGLRHFSSTWDNPSSQRVHERARKARYKAMVHFCVQEKIPYLVCAHHQDDQVETVFMRFLKGSGPMGLCGMKAVQPIEHGRTQDQVYLLRPLLTCPREEIADYAHRHRVPYTNDPSNNNGCFWRGQFRQKQSDIHELLAPLGFSKQNILHTQFLCAESLDFINDSMKLFLKQHAKHNDDSWIIEKEGFLRTHPFLQKKILAYCVKDISGFSYNPSSLTLDTMIQKLTDSSTIIVQTCKLSVTCNAIILNYSKEHDARRMKQRSQN